MALPGAAQFGRNPPQRALAGDGASGARHRRGTHPLGRAGAGIRLLTLAVLALDRVFRECGRGAVTGPVSPPVDNGVSPGSARSRHPLAGPDFDVCDGAARSLLSIL